MQLRFTDFNGAGEALAGDLLEQWEDLNQVLSAMPLHLKASDQAGIKGSPIFDPVGTNQFVADELAARGWQSKVPIPNEFEFLGTDIDFAKRGTVVEVQFSNYPFLLNNTLRSELFFRSGTVFHETPTRLVVVISKAGMFPSSNSTLYYEQALNQLTALSQHHVFTVPMRLVGLFADSGTVEAIWTDYSAARYSRTVIARNQRKFTIEIGRAGRCRIVPEFSSKDL